MSLKTQKLRRLFYNGSYHELLNLDLTHEVSKNDIEQQAYIIAAACRLGDVEKAELLWKALKKKSSSSQATIIAMIHFYFLLYYVRAKSEFKIRSELKRLLKLASQAKNDPSVAFYFFQALGFSLYYRGLYTRSQRATLRSLFYAEKAKSLYFKYLANDLLANSLVHLDNEPKALQYFTKALNCAKTIPSVRATNAATISIALTELRSGIKSQRSIMTRLLKCRELHCEDNYNFSRVSLEIAWLHVLSGRFASASSELKSVREFILTSGNVLHEAQLNILYAMYYYLTEEYTKSRQILAQIDINALDLPYQQRYKALIQLFDADKTKTSLSETQDYKDFLAQLLNRFTNQHLRNSALEEILRRGYLALLKVYFAIEPGKVVYVWGLEPKLLVRISPSEVSVIKTHLNRTSRALMQLICDNKCSRQEIIEAHWGFRYNSERHDALIFPAVSTLNKALGLRQDQLIQSKEGRYFFHAETIFINTMRLAQQVNELEEADLGQYLVDLNFRQVELLRNATKGTWIDVNELIKRFTISRATATRDLAELKKIGVLMAYGKARATKYMMMGA
ncbi:MAG: DeoR family transcriptional regulator [Oligoflexales bacterium]|nr:DeoR family transcriptional regulator [Oligoflexales bacterium]